MAFDLTELLDYESQMSRDAALPREDLAKRDRTLTGRLQTESMPKRVALLHWLKELKGGEGPWPGQALSKSHEAAQILFLLMGLLSGLGMVQGLLRYNGHEPVNIIPFIAFYGLLQIGFLLWYLLKTVVARAFQKLPGGALIYLLKEYAARWLSRRPHLIAKTGFESKVLAAFLQRLKDLHSNFLLMKAWMLLQLFGIGFHLASLITFVLMISFNDYTFAWRTTLRWDAEAFHGIVSALALPFAWASESLRPSLELIEASQFNRFEGQFRGGAEGGLRSAAWWPYLSLLIISYGLLPRCLIAISLRWRSARYLDRLAFDDFQSESLWNRLQRPQAEWASGALEPGRPVPEQPLAEVRALQLKDVGLVLWRDVDLTSEQIRSYLAERHGSQVSGEYAAKGVSADRERILSLLSPHSTLLIVSDPFELPGEAIDKIRLAVRAVAPSTLILFAPLVQVDGQLVLGGDRRAWKHALQIYRDPYLGLLEDV